MTDAAAGPEMRSRRGPRRLWLFAPYAALLVLAAAWSVTWFVIRDRTVAALDAWVDAERAEGRNWTCPGRSGGGFPFRIEVACPALRLEAPGLSLDAGRVVGVAQVYDPRLIILEVGGPLRAAGGSVTAEANWRLFQASLRTAPDGFERLSLALEGMSARTAGLGPEPVTVSAQHAEAHLRPGPAPAAAGTKAFDGSFRAEGLLVPVLAAFGGTQPATIGLDLAVTGVPDDLPDAPPEAIEAWRREGGKVVVRSLRFARGAARLEANGDLGLDEAHRPTGRLQASGAGLQDLLAPLLGSRGALVAGVLGGGRRPDRGNGPSDLRPLPPLRIEAGQVYIGPLGLPNLRLPPLY